MVERAVIAEGIRKSSIFEDDRTWLMSLCPRLEPNDNWLRRINKHLDLACQSDRSVSADKAYTIQSHRNNVFRQMGFFDESHTLHDIWLAEFNKDPENCMSPLFFIENARRLHNEGQDIVAAFEQQPYLFENLGDFRQPEMAHRLARVLGMNSLVGAVLEERPQTKYDNPFKLIAMARIAIDFYSSNEFSSPQQIVKFLRWSPEALLLTALEKDDPAFEDILPMRRLDGLGLLNGANGISSFRRKMLLSMLDNADQATRQRESIKAYFRYLKTVRRVRPSRSREYAASLPQLTQSHIPTIKNFVEAGVELNEAWFAHMNQLIILGSSPGSKAKQIRRHSRQSFFRNLGLFKDDEVGGSAKLPEPRKFVSFIESLQKRNIPNAHEILQKSLYALRNSAEANEEVLALIQERGWDYNDPSVYAQLPLLFTENPIRIKQNIHRKDDPENGGRILSIRFARRQKQLPYEESTDEQIVASMIVEQDLSAPCEPEHTIAQNYNPDCSGSLKLAKYIANLTETRISPDEIVELLTLRELSDIQLQRAKHAIDNSTQDFLKLKDVRKIIDRFHK